MTEETHYEEERSEFDMIVNPVKADLCLCFVRNEDAFSPHTNIPIKISRVYGNIFQCGDREQIPPVCRFFIHLDRKYIVPRTDNSDIRVLLYLVIDEPEVFSLPAGPILISHFLRTFDDHIADGDTINTAQIAVNMCTTLVIPVSRSMNGLNPGYAPRCRCDGQTPEQGFINDLLDKNPERKCSFSEIKACGVCNDIYGLLRLIRHINMKNE